MKNCWYREYESTKKYIVLEHIAKTIIQFCNTCSYSVWYVISENWNETKQIYAWPLALICVLPSRKIEKNICKFLENCECVRVVLAAKIERRATSNVACPSILSSPAAGRGSILIGQNIEWSEIIIYWIDISKYYHSQLFTTMC